MQFTDIDALSRVTHAVAETLWNDYGYPNIFGPWSQAVRYVGLTETSPPEAEARLALAANRCFKAARAVVVGLRNVSVGDLSAVFLGATPRSPEERKVDIFSPIDVWADGSGTSADSPAGAGIVIRYHGPGGRTIGWGEPLGKGTNNHAELSGILYGLRAIEEPDRLRPVVVRSDSQYALGASSGRNRVNANAELIATIRELVVKFRSITFEHVRGHKGVTENEWCDQLAGRAAKTQRRVELDEVK